MISIELKCHWIKAYIHFIHIAHCETVSAVQKTKHQSNAWCIYVDYKPHNSDTPQLSNNCTAESRDFLKLNQKRA